MVVSNANIHNIMGGMESTGGVRLHNHRRKLKQRFDIIRKLGQGTYGKVQLGINKETGQEVAIKTIKKAKIETEADLIRIRREIQIMSSVRHPNIIHIYEVFENREKMVLVMEYAAGGELYDYLSERKVLAQEEARRIFRQIATAVYYCHKHKICHRDLKLENILLDEHGSAKIADFGLSNVFDEQRLLNTFCGSPLYASPEIVKGTPYHGPEVDCWSLGVLLYTLVYGAMPFDGSNFKRLVKQISQGDYFEPKKPSPASPLIREMLTVIPARRADIEKVCSHWWVNEGYAESCLDIAEELANQTPVRLDLLLSLAPPPPEVGSDKLMVTKEQGSDDTSTATQPLIPARCHSVGSLMELDHPVGHQREQLGEGVLTSSKVPTNAISASTISPAVSTPISDTSKRKLEEGISTEEANQGGAKKKERMRRKERERSTELQKPVVEDKNASETTSEVEGHVKKECGEELMDVENISELDLQSDIDHSVCGSRDTIVGSINAATSSLDTLHDSKGDISDTAASHKSPSATSPLTNLSISEATPDTATAVSSSIPLDVNADQPVKVSDKGSTKSSKEKPRKLVKKKTDNSSELHTKSDTQQTGESCDSGNKTDKKEVPKTDETKSKIKRKKSLVSDTNTNDTGNSTNIAVTGDEVMNEVKASNNVPTTPDQNKNFVGASDSEIKSLLGSVPTDPEVEISRKPSTKARKSKGELNLGKLGSSSEKSSGPSTPEEPPTRPMERRRSKIFETAEKFNNLGIEQKPSVDKPKKVFIPGIKVSDAKKAFERKSSVSEVPSILSPTKQSSTKLSDLCTESGEKVSNNISSNGSSSKKGVPQGEGKPSESKSQDTIVKNTGDTVSGNRKPISEHEYHRANQKTSSSDVSISTKETVHDQSQADEGKLKRIKEAVEIIGNAITGDSKKESSDGNRIKLAKPPVPLATDTKTKNKLIGMNNTASSTKSSGLSLSTPSKKMVHVQVGPNEMKEAVMQTGVLTESNEQATALKRENENEGSKAISDKMPAENEIKKGDSTIITSPEDGSGKKKLSKVQITLKSATLPRRKTSKAEIQLDSPVVPIEFKTEVEHMVGGIPMDRQSTRRFEDMHQTSATATPFRSLSLEPEGTQNKRMPLRECIIPIWLEREDSESSTVSCPSPARPPTYPFQQRSMSQSQRSSSLSRQSTQESETEVMEPIRKSPREYIIPIAVEGGGYVTPRAGSLEPSVSDDSTTKPKQMSTSRFTRARRMSSLLSDASEDEGFNSPFVTLQRHSSLNRESDDDDRSFHLHRLRSSRPTRHSLERNDSLSSAEEDDDDDGFEILTAETLFSTLLSRVRSLTQRLTVEDGNRPMFPSTRLMSQLSNMGHSSPASMWKNVYSHHTEPLTRRLSETAHFPRTFSRESDFGPSSWHRNLNRDLSDSDSVYSEANSMTGTLPRASVRMTVHVPGGRGRGESGGEPQHTTSSTY